MVAQEAQRLAIGALLQLKAHILFHGRQEAHSQRLHTDRVQQGRKRGVGVTSERAAHLRNGDLGVQIQDRCEHTFLLSLPESQEPPTLQLRDGLGQIDQRLVSADFGGIHEQLDAQDPLLTEHAADGRP